MRDRPDCPPAGRLPLLSMLVALCLGAGCAVARPPGAPARESRSFSSVSEAQASLDEAERKLLASPAAQGADKNAPPTGGVGAAGPSSAAPPPPPPPTPSPQPASSPRAESRKEAPPGADEAAEERASSPCELACRALGSMRRAAEAICRMTSASDERCVSARKRVTDGESRVERCSCPPEPQPPT